MGFNSGLKGLNKLTYSESKFIQIEKLNG